MKKLILTILFVLLIAALVSSYGRIVHGQEDSEDQVYVPAVPVEIEFIDGDVVISQIGERMFVVTDRGLHEKIDVLIERVASLEATLISQADDDGTQTASSVNINTATYDEMLTVPGIGPVKAGSIIAERGQSGLFEDWSDLMRRVSGVGPATIADMQAGGAVIEP